MSQTSPSPSVVTCPFCGYPYPMSDMQREVYAGRHMGCMNCGRPFKVEAPPPVVIEPDPSAALASADGAAPGNDGTASADSPASAGDTPASTGNPASSTAAKPALRRNPPAAIGFVSALLFFALIAAATVASAVAADDSGAARSGVVPHTPAGILTALAIVSSALAILFSAAGLVRTRRIASAHCLRTAGRGMAVAGLTIGGGGLLITVIVLSTVVPLMDRQREMARRDLCKSNFQAIAAALAQYANANHGHYPDSLVPLVGSGALPPDALVCPSTTDTPAPGTNPNLQAAALAQPGHQSYVYVAKGLTASSPGNTVLLYEPASNHGEVAHVLFLDGLIVSVSANFADPLRRELDTGKNPGPTAVLLHP